MRETPTDVNKVVCFSCELWEWAIQTAHTDLQAGSKYCASLTRGIQGLNQGPKQPIKDKDMVHNCAISSLATYTHTKHNPPKTSALMGPTTVITRHIFGIRHLSSQLKVAPKTKSSVIIVCLLSLFLVLSMSFSLTWVTCHPSYFFVRSLLFLLDFLLNPCLEGALAVLAECRSWWMRCTFQPAGAPWRHNT